jgi:ATP-dependent RNA helicase DeaD
VTQDLDGAGLDARLVAAIRAAGFERLTALQDAALPVLRRGGNAVLHAAEGAGVTGAWSLPLLSRLLDASEVGGEAGEAGGSGPRALVLVPTAERAEAVAGAVAGLAGDSGIAVRAAVPGWRTAGADVLVTTPDRALSQVQGSALKLEAVTSLVFVDAAGLFALYGVDPLGTLVGLVPRDAQRVIVSGELTTDVVGFTEAHARRALTIPARPADPRDTAPRETVAQIGYLVLADAEKMEMLARLLDGVESDVVVRVRTARRAEAVQAELGRRGITTGGVHVHVVHFDGDAAASERVISCDVPFSADELRRLHENGGTVFVTPAELAHFRRIAGEVPFTVKQRRARDLDASELDAFRETLRSALAGEDLTAQLLVLEPLFDEASPAEVAAALSALLRRRGPAQAAVAPLQHGSAPKEATSAGLTRLFISIGARDNVRPGDLVGAITGEAGIKGDQVGRVDIRDTFSVVEVAAAVADKVIHALNGTTMRGRSLRVDYDRKGAGGSGAEGGRSTGPRGPRKPGGPGGPGGKTGGPRRRPQSS